MRKILSIILFISLTAGLSAQQGTKGERSAVRQGNKAYQEQRYEVAAEHYKAAEKENPSSKEASFNLANTYYKQHLWDEALQEYQRYITLENESPEKLSAAWANMGNTFLKKKAEESSKAKTTPQQGAEGQRQEDNLKLTMEAYKNALRLNPNDEEVRYNLAVVQKMIQDQQGGGGSQDKDKEQDKNDKKEEQEKQDQQNENKQDEQKQEKEQPRENQMSQQSMEQILQAIEQEERATQERVQKAMGEERKRKNSDNKRQNKDW